VPQVRGTEHDARTGGLRKRDEEFLGSPAITRRRGPIRENRGWEKSLLVEVEYLSTQGDCNKHLKKLIG